MEKQKNYQNNWSRRTPKTTGRLAKWTILWVLTVAVPAFGPVLIWGENNLIDLLAILLNVGVGIKMIIVNIEHLNAQDEMMQKIQLEAMGVSLGVAIVGGIAYSMMDVTNLIPFNAEISGLVVLIGLTYLISLFINMRRYQ